jgi:tRNA(adenine34) deaminase
MVLVMNDNEAMRLALKEAQKAAKENEVPVGAVVILNDQVIGVGHNQREGLHDISSHAEIEAIKDAEAHLGNWRLEGATLYVTMEPCLMCAGAILQSRLSRLVYGVDDPKAGAIVSNLGVFNHPELGDRPLVSRDVLSKESSDLLREFFAKKRK